LSALRTICLIGSSQTLSWASSYYLPAVLAAPIAADLGLTEPFFFLCFSASLMIAAIVGPRAGRWIDRRGGRVVLPVTNLIFASGLFMLAFANGPLSLLMAWLVLGIAMGYGLYDTAFAALVYLYGVHARKAITGITLIAGFASTVGWPLSSLMLHAYGWRGAVIAWALLHLSLGLLLNRLIPASPGLEHENPGPTLAPANRGAAEKHRGNQAQHGHRPEESHNDPEQPQALPRFAGALLIFSFAATGFVSSAMAAHLPSLLQATGASLALAISASTLIGPAQVGARLCQFAALGHAHPLWSAWISTLTHPLGVLLLLAGGPGWAIAFTICHGLGTGTQTIARGALPLALFGAKAYGERLAKLLALSRFTQALAPWLFGLAIDHWKASALWIGLALSIAAFIALLPFRSVVRAS
jgi:MFS family permease